MCVSYGSTLQLASRYLFQHHKNFYCGKRNNKLFTYVRAHISYIYGLPISSVLQAQVLPQSHIRVLALLLEMVSHTQTVYAIIANNRR